MKRSYQMDCLFCSNVGDVKMKPFVSYVTNIMLKIFYRKLKTNLMSIRTGKVEYIMKQKDHKCRHKSVTFTCEPPLEFSCLTRNTIRDARNILQI